MICNVILNLHSFAILDKSAIADKVNKVNNLSNLSNYLYIILQITVITAIKYSNILI